MQDLQDGGAPMHRRRWCTAEIKVLKDLGLMITAESIDIKVLADLWPVFPAGYL